ncbi:uncharacterized protein DUF805 [Kineococcus xinjiangensis]|uniref:Uncharacterized protein DUF805 n=1 Tax=Kineococcus xinjiangensis TaxID=512762 RepID=A0A2S6IVG9_9ACTN|nr:uncharacterized protein DUF805 [Kineococcus xinjiangensis]
MGQFFATLAGMAGPGSAVVDVVEGVGGLALLGVILGFVLPSLAVTVRRLQDTGRSGWWMLISAVPLAGPIVLLVLLAQDSEPGPNRFGPCPKFGGGWTGGPRGGPYGGPYGQVPGAPYGGPYGEAPGGDAGSR